MSRQEITAVFIIALLLAAGAYDLFTRLAWGQSATISQVLRDWGRAWPPFVPLVAVALFLFWWHLFGGRR